MDGLSLMELLITSFEVKNFPKGTSPLGSGNIFSQLFNLKPLWALNITKILNSMTSLFKLCAFFGKKSDDFWRVSLYFWQIRSTPPEPNISQCTFKSFLKNALPSSTICFVLKCLKIFRCLYFTYFCSNLCIFFSNSAFCNNFYRKFIFI